MHVLMTTDTVGGVWTYTQELVSALIEFGIRVTLVSFGRAPSPEQQAWSNALARAWSDRFAYVPCEYKLEWMEGAGNDLRTSAAYLQELIVHARPDLLHSNQFHYGALDVPIPKVVVAHSDVVSWWHAVHGAPPPLPDWGAYVAGVKRGLDGADAIVCPTAWMKQQITAHYAPRVEPAVIWNGRSPGRFRADRPKKLQAVTLGRRWDEGKNIALLEGIESAMPILVAGDDAEPGRAVTPAPRADQSCVRFLGQQSENQARELLETSSVYIATSRYEPFGLAPLEAALAGCAIVANDIASLREVWSDAALFFETNSRDALTGLLGHLVDNPDLIPSAARQAYQHARQHLSSFAMSEGYVRLYRTLAGAGGRAR